MEGRRVVMESQGLGIDQLCEFVRTGSAFKVRGSRASSRFLCDQAPDIPELAVDLSGVIDHDVSDQVIKVRAGTSIQELQSVLAKHGQCLPFGGFSPDGLSFGGALEGTVGGWLSLNLPHCYEADCGNWRDWVLGLTIVRADGTVARCGSKAVKNVAGYDVQKLFVGARGSLVVVAEITLRVFPVKAMPPPDLRNFNLSEASHGVIQRTKLTDFSAALESAGEDIICTNPRTATLYRKAESLTGITRFPGDWVIGWGPSMQKLDFTDESAIQLMKRTKTLFDPTAKLNPGALGIF